MASKDGSDDMKHRIKRMTGSGIFQKKQSVGKLERKASDIKVVAQKFEGSSFQSDDYEASDTAYRKAYNSLLLEDIFYYLQCLVQDEGSRKKKLANTELSTNINVLQQYMESRRILVKRISKFINIMVSYKNRRSDMDYPAIFHQYMKEHTITDENNILNAERVYAYKQLLSVYINSPFIKTEGSSKLEEKAKELFQFFDQYRIDCYSCLIGLAPSDTIIDLLLYNKESVLFERQEEDIAQSSSEMYHEIIGWASCKDSPSKIVSEIKKYAAILRGVNRLKKGDVVVMEASRGSFMYARYAGSYSSEYGVVDLWLDCDQTEISISIDHVWPLPASVTKFIAENLPVRYEKLISSPLDPLFAKVMKFATDYVKGKLDSLGLAPELLARANHNECSILDLSLLRDTTEQFKKLIPPSKAMIGEFESILEEDIQTFLKDINPNMLFQPTATNTMEQVNSFDFAGLLNMALNSYKGVLQSALDQISIQKRELLSGTRKNCLVEWWLNLISASVNKKLISINFDENAVPSDYTAKPPKDFRLVYKNIGILREALDSEQDIHNIKELTDDVCRQIYPKICAFIVDSKVAVLEYMKMPCDRDAVASFDTAAIKQNIQAQMKELTEDDQQESKIFTKLDWLHDLVSDIEYLETMIAMEDASEEERKQNFHIVPVSSLVISRLCRMENEHKTVLELWAPVAYVSKLSGQYKRSPMHRAISVNDLKALKSLMKKQGGSENEQDHNGWTPLHCAASAEEKIPMCKVLLEAGANVNTANNEGNTPVHYLARCSVNIPEKEATQLETLREMIRRGGDVNAMNDLGETPLHASCFLGNLNVARILLESYADPNSITKEGESPLHYAVQARNAGVVELLLEFGANPYLTCKGQNPIDLAYRYHVPEITEIFRMVPLACEVNPGDSFSPRHRRGTLLATQRKPKRKRTLLKKSTQ